MQSKTPSDRLRILQIVPTYYPAVRYGGPIKSVHGLSKALVRRGHSVEVYTSSMDGPSDLDVPLFKAVCVDDVLVHYFPVPLLRRLCWCPSLRAQLRANLGNFDVVHLQSVFLWPTFAGAREAKSSGVPYIMSPRGMLGHEVIRRKNQWIKQAWIQMIERKSLRNAKAIHITAEVEGQELSRLGLDLSHLSCIPNGLDTPTNYPELSQRLSAALPKRYALFLSRINWKKGLDRLLRSWVSVPDLPLVIAGNDEEQYQPLLERMASDLGIEQRVHFIGPIDDDSKWALYRNASLFVLPSYSENFGNVVAEAMAMECPVLITEAVGLAPFVKQFNAGLVVKGEEQEIAAAVKILMDNSELRMSMGINGKTAVASHLSWDAVAESMEVTYRSAIRH
jgi:glycosyltransferase involved in cell wall biosynthesis